MNFQSVIWAIALTLFIGALGLPVPENPLLMGGGYAIFKQICPPAASLALWYLAIIIGDAILFAVSHWFFTLPALSALMKRFFSEKRLETYQKAFADLGGWTLFLARFTFGIRAVAYIAAGAARYSWKRFLLVDGLSVAIQVILFVGIGYFAGDRIEWAEDAGEKIILVLGILALVTILITWMSSSFLKRLSARSRNR